MIVVTGAAGFIGSNLIADLESEDRGPIAAVDWFGSDERWRNLAKRRIDHFIRPEALPAFLDLHAREVAAVVHLGAISATTERDVDLLVERNVNASVALWDWCAAHGVPFVYASSAATYGGIEEGFGDEDAIAAQQALRPLNAYGWSKRAVDLIFAQRVARGQPAPPRWAGCKFFNVYGPNEYHKGAMMSVACQLHAQIAAGERARLFRSYRPGIADGMQRRDFVHVADCTAAIRFLLDCPTVHGLFNVGSGEARSFLDVAGAVARAMGRPLEIDFIEMTEAIRGQYQYFTEAPLAKLRALGFAASALSLEDGIAAYVGDYLSQADRYR